MSSIAWTEEEKEQVRIARRYCASKIDVLLFQSCVTGPLREEIVASVRAALQQTVIIGGVGKFEGVDV